MSNNRDIFESQVGWNGSEYISDTTAHYPPANMVYTAIMPLADATISAITGEGLAGTFTGAIIPKGVPFYGRFSSITLTSGTIIAYKGV